MDKLSIGIDILLLTTLYTATYFIQSHRVTIQPETLLLIPITMLAVNKYITR